MEAGKTCLWLSCSLIKRLSSCAAIVSLIVSTFFFSLFASASHLEMLLLSCGWGGIPQTKIAQHKLDCHLPCIHSWLRISWHLERLSIVYLSLLWTFFSWHQGHCLPSLWSCHRIVTTTHSQTSNDATSDSELQSSEWLRRSRRLRRRCTIRLFRNGRLNRTQLRDTFCPRHWCRMHQST